MPRGHGRISSNVENEGRRNHSLRRRCLNNSNYELSSEERQISALILGNAEQRCIFITLAGPELDSYCKLATILQSLQSPDKKNHFPSEVPSESQPAISFLFNVQKEHSTNLSENLCSSQSSSVCSSSGMNNMGQSRNRHKRSKPLKDSSNTSAMRCLTEDTSSGSLYDSLSPLSSNDLMNDISKVEEPPKRGSKKKGKKKGKHYKRFISKKGSSEVESHKSGHPASLGKQELSFSPTSIVEDITKEKDDSETNTYVDSSTTLVSCISYSDEMKESDAVNFRSHEAFISDNQELKGAFGAKQSSDIPTVYASIKSPSPKKSISVNHNSRSISSYLYDNDATVGSCQDISGEVDSDLKQCDSSLYGSIVVSCVVANGVSNDYFSGDSYCNSTERVQCSNQACSSNDFHPVLHGKRARAARKLTSHTGKDNHPVWQKVQKMDKQHFINEPKNAYIVSNKVDISSKDSGSRSRQNASLTHQKLKTGKPPYSYEIVSETSKSGESNVKKKHSSVPKQINHYSRNGPHNGTMTFAKASNLQVQQKEELKMLTQVNHDECTSSGSSSFNIKCPKSVIKSTENFDFCPSVQQQKTKVHTCEASLSEDTCSVAGNMTLSVECIQIDPSLLASDSSGQSNKVDTKGHADNDLKGHGNLHNGLYLMEINDNQYENLQDECSHTECRDSDNKSGPLLQKWVPVGREDVAVSQIGHLESLTTSATDASISNNTENKNAEVEVSYDAMQFSNRSGDDAYCSSSETDILGDKFIGCSRGEGCVCNYKDEQFSNVETELGKMMLAVNDAYKLQTAAGVDLFTGSHVAEFEKFMHSYSPVLSQRHDIRICTTCSGDHETSNSMCLHQMHNISLASLWQWYEEPGCYGLEVKGEDNHKSRRLCDGFVEFRAYFVPYLSSIQLFRRSGSSREMTVSREVDKMLTSTSNISSLPIFCKLLPQSHKEVDPCLLESTSSPMNEFSNPSSESTNLIDDELIFEYFEHAQPPQRRPLFEKIKELVNGGGSSNSQLYGDPSKLEYLSLHDLHPASWYSVAWYPIYRIPEDNFRAAFLTYHSLGHFIRQSSLSNMAGDFTRVIFPVVGLQSYNAKQECWFQPRELKEESSISSPSKLVEERLRILEHTAFVMATAKVRKGNQISNNNHPDYNHFSSRW